MLSVTSEESGLKWVEYEGVHFLHSKQFFKKIHVCMYVFTYLFMAEILPKGPNGLGWARTKPGILNMQVSNVDW